MFLLQCVRATWAFTLLLMSQSGSVAVAVGSSPPWSSVSTLWQQSSGLGPSLSSFFLCGGTILVISHQLDFYILLKCYTVRKGHRFCRPHPGSHLPFSLDGDNQRVWLVTSKLFPSRESLVSDFPAGDGKIDTLFYSVFCDGFCTAWCLSQCTCVSKWVLK